jgi:hypothetical protein
MMTFREFWPQYLEAHRHPRNRAAHYFATALSFAAIALAIVFGAPWIALAAIAASYAIAIAAHRLFERNYSLVTVNPVWGAMADLKMCWLALTGRLSAEIERHTVKTSRWQDRAARTELGARLSGC